MSGKKVAFVTGANGFVGSHLSLALANKGITVIGLTYTHKKPFNSSMFPLGFFYQIVGDIRDKSVLKKIFAKYRPDYCFHLAATSTVEEGQNNPSQTCDTNINGAINILEFSRIYDTKKIIIASTSHVYGNNPNVPYTEDNFPQPSRIYETSKTCVDLIAQSYANSFGMPIQIPRFVNIYGPGDFNLARLIPKTMKQVIDGRVKIWGGDTTRDYLYIDDAISAYFRLMDVANTGKNKVVNFGSGKPLTVLQLVKKIIEISGKDIPIRIEKESGRKLEVKQQYLALEKAHQIFQWHAQISLKEGLSRTFNWYNKHLK